MQETQVTNETDNFLVATSDLPEAPEPKEESKEPEAKAEDKGKDAESTEQSEEVKDEEAKPKAKKSRSQRRIETLSAEKKKAAERIAELEAQIGAKNETKTDAEIDPADYDDFEDYEKAVEASKKPKKEVKEKQKELSPDYVKAMEDLQTKFDDGADKFEDFDEKTQNQDLKITEHMVIAFNEIDNPVDAVYYYASNPEDAEKISKMTPAKQMLSVVKKAEMLAKKPTKKTTNAPDPIETVGNEGEFSKDVNQMSFKEFEAKRNSESSGKKFW